LNILKASDQTAWTESARGSEGKPNTLSAMCWQR
jgi:hypothetical protein